MTANSPDFATIAHCAIQRYIQTRLLDIMPTPQDESDDARTCESKSMCLTGDTFNKDKREYAALNLALTFNTLADFEQAITDYDNRIDAADEGRRPAIASALQASSPDDFQDGVDGLLDPFRLIAERYDLRDVAVPYACLLLEWDRPVTEDEDSAKAYNFEDIPEESIMGRILAHSFQEMAGQELYEDWLAQARATVTPDRRHTLETIVSRFAPHA